MAVYRVILLRFIVKKSQATEIPKRPRVICITCTAAINSVTCGIFLKDMFVTFLVF